jgi:hypothetical protein
VSPLSLMSCPSYRICRCQLAMSCSGDSARSRIRRSNGEPGGVAQHLGVAQRPPRPSLMDPAVWWVFRLVLSVSEHTLSVTHRSVSWLQITAYLRFGQD